MNNTILNNIIGWILIIGTYISYTPQFYRLYVKKNATGINEYMLIYGCLSSLLNVLGTIQINLYIYYHEINCDTVCYYNNILPIIQLSSPMICMYIFYFIFIYYSSCNNKRKFYSFIAINFLISIGIIIQNFLFFDYADIKFTGNILNTISAVFSVFMWIPQIIESIQLKTNASLSIITLILHASGCGLTIIYQVVFNHQSFWVILCYIIGLIAESTIVIICIYYNKRNKKRFQDKSLDDASEIANYKAL